MDAVTPAVLGSELGAGGGDIGGTGWGQHKGAWPSGLDPEWSPLVDLASFIGGLRRARLPSRKVPQQGGHSHPCNPCAPSLLPILVTSIPTPTQVALSTPVSQTPTPSPQLDPDWSPLLQHSEYIL